LASCNLSPYLPQSIETARTKTVMQSPCPDKRDGQAD
jgi:hypothetical protein